MRYNTLSFARESVNGLSQSLTLYKIPLSSLAKRIERDEEIEEFREEIGPQLGRVKPAA